MQTWELALIIAASVIAVLGLCIYICLKPKHLGDGVYNPSLFTQMTFTSSKSDYSNESYPKTYTGDLKVLVVCTEKGDMPMANGKVFHTGNHPVETLLPMLHMKVR
jgi:molecular chaperone Hsp31 and glyoxalase 3